jgi:hypothetical protein
MYEDSQQRMKVELMPGIKSISGSIKQKNGRHMVFKTFNRPDGKKETRAYSIIYERRTSYSPKEKAAQERFAICAQAVKRIRLVARINRKEAWELAKQSYERALENGYTPISADWLAADVCRKYFPDAIDNANAE